jgi:hypothetical protein
MAQRFHRFSDGKHFSARVWLEPQTGVCGPTEAGTHEPMAVLESIDHGRCRYRLSALVGLPVRIGDVEVGRIADVILNRSFGHALGFVVAGRGAHRHFLPWVAARVEGDHVATHSIFALLSTSELAFYLGHGAPLSGELPNRVEDVLVDAEGDVLALLDRAPRGAAAPRRTRRRRSVS